MDLTNKTVLVTGGTGSLGKVLIRRLLTGEIGKPRKIIVFSRDEAKQHDMRINYLNNNRVTDDVVYKNYHNILDFRIGDVRDYNSVAEVLRCSDVVFNAAALKQVPTCEYFPYQAVLTNIIGPENIIKSIQELNLNIETVVGISTDKACKPVNVMGMTKSIQERLFIQANMRCSSTRFVCVRYGNVLASRGSVIPLFLDQIRNGGPVTITSTEMTRFLISLDQAVDTVFAAYKDGKRGETYVPRVPSANVLDIANAMIGNLNISKVVTGIRPGEKLHEILISEEECNRTVDRNKYYAIKPMLAELNNNEVISHVLSKEYSSADSLITAEEVQTMLNNYGLLPSVSSQYEGELLR